MHPVSTHGAAGRRSVVGVCGLAIMVWIAAMALLWPAQGALLNWDEVDYANAARLGAWANAVESGSLSPSDFAAFVLAKSSSTAPELPAGYDESQDPLLLRHYHPPLVTYLLSAVAGSGSERVIRSVQLLGALALCLTILFSYHSLAGAVRFPGMVCVSVLTLWLSVHLFGSVSSHGWQAVWTTASAALLHAWLRGGRSRRQGVLLCAGLALSLLTLETGLLVAAGVLICLAIQRLRFGETSAVALPWRDTAIGVALVGVVVVAAWPGAVLKASALKIPALYLYRIWRGEEYAAVPGQWTEVATAILPVLVPALLAVLWLFCARRVDWPVWSPFLLVGGVYALAMARFAIQPQYLLPGLAALVCLVGVAVDQFARTRLRMLAIMLSLLAIAASLPAGGNNARDEQQRDDLRWLAGALQGREALVDGGHIYDYYLGPAYSITPLTVSARGDALLVRRQGAYVELDRNTIGDQMVIIGGGRRELFGGSTEAQLLAGCARTARFTIVAYDCRGG